MNRFGTSTRSAGWIAGSILIGAALLAPAAVLANEASQDLPISWDQAKLGTVEQCSGLGLTEDQVFWHFVQNQVADNVSSGNLTATFQEAGVVGPVVSYQKSGGSLHWGVTTGRDTVLALSTNVQSDGQLVVSHVCWTTPPSDPPTTPPSDDPSVPPPPPSDDPSVPPPPPSDDPSVPPPPPSASPSSSVEAVTGTPRITPPPTDSMGGDSSSGAGWGIAMLAIGGLTALALLASPVRRRIRR